MALIDKIRENERNRQAEEAMMFNSEHTALLRKFAEDQFLLARGCCERLTKAISEGSCSPYGGRRSSHNEWNIWSAGEWPRLTVDFPDLVILTGIHRTWLDGDNSFIASMVGSRRAFDLEVVIIVRGAPAPVLEYPCAWTDEMVRLAKAAANGNRGDPSILVKACNSALAEWHAERRDPNGLGRGVTQEWFQMPELAEPKRIREADARIREDFAKPIGSQPVAQPCELDDGPAWMNEIK